MQYYSDSSEEKDIKPLILNNDHFSSGSVKKWQPHAWHDGNRRSAFQPYKQSCTVLTNLQRGNTPAATPVPQATDINFHTRAGQGEITEEDIMNEKSVDICDDNGLTALHWAANYGQINVVKLLLAHHAMVDREGPDGETPLLLAANGGHNEVVKVLIKEGADVNHVDHACNTGLMYAAGGNHPHTCNDLLAHNANLTLVNLNGETAYDLAVDSSSYLAQAILENHLLDLLK
ncbi:ankyrin repeat family A protein 2-like [Atheta coriaria]|uniref:ankyrin repeat family A protein 2-like n=1 Tax=Dalotia coriaria TaxID=877792 RepID=UPI0031F3EDA5